MLDRLFGRGRDEGIKTLTLKPGESFQVGDIKIVALPNKGYEVTSPFGFNGQTRTDIVPYNNYSVGSDERAKDGTIQRHTIVFQRSRRIPVLTPLFNRISRSITSRIKL